MARFVKSKFFPSAPCNLLILLNKKRVCGCNSSLITKGLRLVNSTQAARQCVVTLP